MNLLVYKEKRIRWAPSGYNDGQEIEEEYFGEIENILFTDEELLNYLDDSNMIIINIIKLNEEQARAFKTRV